VDEITKQVIQGKVHIHVGKKGITKELITQISIIMRNKILIKVKFLDISNYNTLEEAFLDLSLKTKTEIIDKRGKTCVIKKKINSN